MNNLLNESEEKAMDENVMTKTQYEIEKLQEEQRKREQHESFYAGLITLCDKYGLTYEEIDDLLETARIEVKDYGKRQKFECQKYNVRPN
jgi:alanyl-tRNA synthetase